MTTSPSPVRKPPRDWLVQLAGPLAWSGLCLLAVGAFIALWPEPPARPLIEPNAPWQVSEHIGRVPLESLGSNRHLRTSVATAPGAVVYRTWTPDAQIQPGTIQSPPFTHNGAPFIVPVTGDADVPSGALAAFVMCSLHDGRVPIFLGSVNTNFNEAFVQIGTDWCRGGELSLRLEAKDASANIGIGSPYVVTNLSLWKRSFVGLLPYAALAAAFFAAMILAGAAISRALKLEIPPLLAGLISFGLSSLAAFFATAFVSWGGILILMATVLAGGFAARRIDFRQLVNELRPYALVWLAIALANLALLSLAYQGLGHWEPNDRFSPASWSSDNELPGMFAEGLRQGRPLEPLFGGGWMPTDRPPLLAGSLVLVAGGFDALQIANDGNYLLADAFNVAALFANALWAPVLAFCLINLFALTWRRAVIATIVAAFIPFFVFNTIYGWPKMIGAALALGAVTIVFAPDRKEPGRGEAGVYGLLCACSLLAHMSHAPFLVAASIVFLVRRLHRAPLSLATGVAVGLVPLAAWAVFQALTVPSHDPLLRYALTGDFDFGAKTSLLTAVGDHYASLSFATWLSLKWQMLESLITPSEWSKAATVAVDYEPGVKNGFASGLRRWDLLYLYAGNLPILLGALIWWRRYNARRPLAIAVALSVAATFGVMWLLFFTPMFIPTLPYSALLALAAVSLAGFALRGDRAFSLVGSAIAIYTGIVWILAPAWTALSIDIPAALFLLLLIAAAVAYCWPDRINSRARAAPSH